MIRLLSVLLVVALAAAKQTNPTPTPAQPDVVNSHHVLHIPGQKNSKLVADVVYTGRDPKRRRPTSTSRQTPSHPTNAH